MLLSAFASTLGAFHSPAREDARAMQPADTEGHLISDLAQSRARKYLMLRYSESSRSPRWAPRLDEAPSAELVEENFQAFAAALRNATRLRPRLIVSEGCSGSSATVQITERLLEAHGIRSTIGQDSERFKCEKNPFCGDGNVTAAMIGIVAEAVADGLSLVVKSESDWAKAGKLGFDVMRAFGTHAVVAWRSNSLSKLVCATRDCFGEFGEASNPNVQLTGPNEQACFDRRKLPSWNQSRVWLNVTTLVEHGLAPKQSMPATLAGHLVSHGWSMRNGPLAEEGGTVATVTTESLLGHEASNETSVLERAVTAWSALLTSLGVEPQDGLVRKELTEAQGTRPGTSILQALDNSCLDEVIAELKRAGNPYDHMIEGNAEL